MPRRLVTALWLSAAFVLLVRANQATNSNVFGGDLHQVLNAGDALLHHRPVFDDPRFLYAPSAALLIAPFAALPVHAADLLLLAIALACLVAAVFGSVLLAYGRVLGAAVAGGLLALGWWLPTIDLMQYLNSEMVAVAALPFVLLALSRGREAQAGALLGAALAVKPILAPIVLVVVLLRAWRCLAWTVAMPAALSLVALAVIAHPLDWFTKTVPFLLGGQDDFVLGHDGSLVGVGRALSLSPMALAPVRLLVLAVGVAACVTRTRQAGDRVLMLVESSALILLTSFIAGSVAFEHYDLLLLALYATVLRPGSAARESVLLWLGVALLMALGALPGSAHSWFEPLLTMTAHVLQWLALCWFVFSRAAQPGPVDLPEPERMSRSDAEQPVP